MDVTSSTAISIYVKNNSRIAMRLILCLTLCLIVSLMLPSFAANTPTQSIPKGPISDFDLPIATAPITKVQYGINIESLPKNTNYFYSNQFTFINGGLGYIGLQEKGSRVDGTVGQTAVFSIFDSGIAATPSTSCSVERSDQNFDGYVDREGTSCRVPFVLNANTKYSLFVQRGAIDSSGTWWTGSIKDENTGVVTTIASIKVYAKWSTLNSWSALWTEYFGGLPATCAALPYSRVRFYTPIANDTLPAKLGGNRYSPTGNCTNVNIYRLENTYVQEMGGNTVMGSTPVLNTTPLPPVSIPSVVEGTTPPSGTIYVPATTPPSGTIYVPTTKVPVPTITVPPAPTAPTGIIALNNGCFIIWCTVTLKWNGPKTAGTSYVVVAGSNAPVTLKTNSLTIPWVVANNIYKISITSVSASGVKSATTITNVWV